MSELPKWKISELKTRYTLEPELSDYFLEGFFDKEILEKFCTEQNIVNKNFYPVNCIDVPKELLEKYSLTNGNKQRLIALATELSNIQPKSIVILIDKDLDPWINSVYEIENLEYTEYSCLEISLIDESLLREILLNIANCKIPNWNTFLSSFYQSLKIFNLIRLTSRKLFLHLKWIDPRKNLHIHQDLVIFEHLEYIKKLLIHNSKSSSSKEFIDTFGILLNENLNNMNFKYLVRGHDLIYLLAFVTKTMHGIKEFQSDQALKRLLLFNTKNVEKVNKPFSLLFA
jgi:hypothetical protein